MKQVILLSTFLLLSFFSASCVSLNSSAPLKPTWIDSESSRYPNSKYLTATGSGNSRKKAEEEAYAAMSKIFVAKIEQRTEERESYIQSDEKRGKTWRRDINISQLTTLSTNKILEDVTIAENYFDKSNSTYFALSVIDRKKESSVLRRQVSDLDEEIDALLSMSDQSNNKLRKIRLLHQSIEKKILRDTYNSELRILSPTGSSVASQTNLSLLEEKLQKFITKNLRIHIQVTGKNSEQIYTALVEGLNNEGFPVSYDTGTDEADLTIKGSVDFQPVSNPEAIFVRWTANFELRDMSEEKIIGSVVRNGREGHLDKSRAEARALHSAQKDLSEEISRQLVDYIFGKKP